MRAKRPPKGVRGKPARWIEMPRLCRPRGHTLVELIAATLLLGIVAVIVLSRFTDTASDAKRNACYTLKGNIELQSQLWYRHKAAWPASSLSDIAADVTYFPEGIGKCPVDGTAYQLDSATHEVIGHTH